LQSYFPVAAAAAAAAGRIAQSPAANTGPRHGGSESMRSPLEYGHKTLHCWPGNKEDSKRKGKFNK